MWINMWRHMLKFLLRVFSERESVKLWVSLIINNTLFSKNLPVCFTSWPLNFSVILIKIINLEISKVS